MGSWQVSKNFYGRGSSSFLKNFLLLRLPSSSFQPYWPWSKMCETKKNDIHTFPPLWWHVVVNHHTVTSKWCMSGLPKQNGRSVCVYFQQKKKARVREGKESRYYLKTRMITKDNERLTWTLSMSPLRQNTEETERGKDLKSVWDDVNGWNET